MTYIRKEVKQNPRNKAKKRKNLNVFQHISQKFVQKTISFFYPKTDAYTLVLLAIRALSSDRGICRAPRSVVACMAGVSEATVSRMSHCHWEDGLLTIHSYRSSDGKQHNYYVLSKAFTCVRKVQKYFFSAIKRSLSEYVTLLREKLISLFRKKKISIYKKRYNTRNKIIFYKNRLSLFRNDPRE